MIPLRHISPLPDAEKGILRTLLYYDIFHYPLTEQEIFKFSPVVLDSDWQSALANLVKSQIVYLKEGFYTLHDSHFLVARRKAGNQLAQRRTKTARKISSLISLVPFVRSVMLSGSISKGYMDEKSDIDYFIITAPRRLWLVRGGLALCRRIFLLNSHKYFCTNYFIDSENLEIGQKNIFTAIEATTLLPMSGMSHVAQFQAANAWCRNYLPNQGSESGFEPERDNWLKRFSEKIFPSKFLDLVDVWLMKKFIKHWNNEYQHLLNKSDFSIAFQSTRQVSRSHPEFYQKKVLALYEEKVRDLESQYGVSLQ